MIDVRCDRDQLQAALAGSPAGAEKLRLLAAGSALGLVVDGGSEVGVPAEVAVAGSETVDLYAFSTLLREFEPGALRIRRTDQSSPALTLSNEAFQVRTLYVALTPPLGAAVGPFVTPAEGAISDTMRPFFDADSWARAFSGAIMFVLVPLNLLGGAVYGGVVGHLSGSTAIGILIGLTLGALGSVLIVGLAVGIELLRQIAAELRSQQLSGR